MSDELTLPGKPGPALASVWERLSDASKRALRPHLLGGTAADWIANVLTEAELPIGATSIKNYRRRLAESGVSQ